MDTEDFSLAKFLIYMLIYSGVQGREVRTSIQIMIYLFQMKGCDDINSLLVIYGGGACRINMEI